MPIRLFKGTMGNASHYTSLVKSLIALRTPSASTLTFLSLTIVLRGPVVYWDLVCIVPTYPWFTG